MNELVTRSVVYALINSLKQKMPSIVKAYDDFPNQSQKLQFPSFSVFTQQPKFNANSPYVISKDMDVDGNPIKDANGQVKVLKCVGNYDFDIQIDIWCESKIQRQRIYEEYFAAFHSVYPTMGLNYKMEDYHNEYANFVQTNLKFMDDGELSSQRNEWRIKIDVLGSCRAVVRSLEHLIETIENNTSISNEPLIENTPANVVNQVI